MIARAWTGTGLAPLVFHTEQSPGFFGCKISITCRPVRTCGGSGDTCSAPRAAPEGQRCTTRPRGDSCWCPHKIRPLMQINACTSTWNTRNCLSATMENRPRARASATEAAACVTTRRAVPRWRTPPPTFELLIVPWLTLDSERGGAEAGRAGDIWLVGSTGRIRGWDEGTGSGQIKLCLAWPGMHHL